ncbi:MAG: hypothetical protein ACRENW_01340 [Thermodesulfobacteriota bacterium]
MSSGGEKHAAAAIRIKVALDSIQEAQRLIEHAKKALSAVAGMSSERKRVGCLSQQLTWTWFAVSATANRLRRTTRPAPHGK